MVVFGLNLRSRVRLIMQDTIGWNKEQKPDLALYVVCTNALMQHVVWNANTNYAHGLFRAIADLRTASAKKCQQQRDVCDWMWCTFSTLYHASFQVFFILPFCRSETMASHPRGSSEWSSFPPDFIALVSNLWHGECMFGSLGQNIGLFYFVLHHFICGISDAMLILSFFIFSTDKNLSEILFLALLVCCCFFFLDHTCFFWPKSNCLLMA